MAKPLLLVEALAVGNDSGLGRHVRIVVGALEALRDVADIRVVLPRGSNFSPPPGIGSIRVPVRPYRLFCEVFWPAMIAAMHPKVVLCLGQSLPAIRFKARYALLVPDVAPLETLPFTGSGHPEFNGTWMRKRIPKADVLLTSTAFTRRRLQELLGFRGGKTFLVPPVDDLNMKGPSPRNTKTDGPVYFLAVGNVEPRKNYPGLLRAYALAQSRAEMPPLHILGHAAWDGGEARKVVETLGLGQRVTFHGHVSEAVRVEWLQNCRAFIAPSLYEGFGLPLFEALHMGKACLFHGASAQNEFASDCALATDCSNTELLAAALVRLATEEDLRLELESKAKNEFPKRWADYSPGSALRKAILPLLV